MKFDYATQAERFVALLNSHPFSCCAFLLMLWFLAASQKDGLFSRYLGYRQAREDREAALEMRRIEIISMLENRRQPELPGIESEGGDVS